MFSTSLPFSFFFFLLFFLRESETQRFYSPYPPALPYSTDSSISASESALDSALMSNMSNHIRASAAQGSFSLNRSTGQGQGQSLAQAQGQGRDLAQMERRSHYSRSRASGR